CDTETGNPLAAVTRDVQRDFVTRGERRVNQACTRRGLIRIGGRQRTHADRVTRLRGESFEGDGSEIERGWRSLTRVVRVANCAAAAFGVAKRDLGREQLTACLFVDRHPAGARGLRAVVNPTQYRDVTRRGC